MCDEKERTENGEGRVDSGDQGMFDRCAPMMKGMFGKFRDIMREAPGGSPAQAAGATESAGLTGTAMSKLKSRERELVALGAAMGSNCVPCIEYHVPKAREAGLGDDQIREAIRLADKVRKVPARKVLDTALQLLSDDAADATADPDTPPRRRGVTPPAADGACCG
jgi:AhpD family alkylhydroperoxidase